MPTNSQSTKSSTLQSTKPDTMQSKSSIDTAVGFIIIAIVIFIVIYLVRKYRAKNNIAKTPNTDTDNPNTTNTTRNQNMLSSLSVQEDSSLYAINEDEYTDNANISNTKSNNDEETLKPIYEHLSQSERDILALQKQIDALSTKSLVHNNLLSEHSNLIREHSEWLKRQYKNIKDNERALEKVNTSIKDHDNWLRKQFATIKTLESLSKEHEHILNKFKTTISKKANFLTIITVILLILLISVTFF